MNLEWTADLDWGNVPEWLSLSAAIAAAVVAAILLRQQARQLNLQADQLAHEVRRANDTDAAAAYESKIAQARRVYCKVTRQGAMQNGVALTVSFKVKVVNGSNGIVDHVSVIMRCPGVEWLRSPNEVRTELGRLLPDEEPEPTVGFEFDGSELSLHNAASLGFRSEVTFTDAAGVRWKIDNEHRLSELV